MVKIWVKTLRCNTYTNIYIITAQQFMEKNDFVVSLVSGDYFKKRKKKKKTHIYGEIKTHQIVREYHKRSYILY